MNWSSDAPRWVNPLSTRCRGGAPGILTSTRKPTILRSMNRRCESDNPVWPLRRETFRACSFGWPRTPGRSARIRRQVSLSGPGLWKIPVDMSTFARRRSDAGRMDWKNPRQRTSPPPISLVSELVKNDRTLNGKFRLGCIRTTTLRACSSHCVNEKPVKTEKVLTVMAVKTLESADWMPCTKRLRTLGTRYVRIFLARR